MVKLHFHYPTFSILLLKYSAQDSITVTSRHSSGPVNCHAEKARVQEKKLFSSSGENKFSQHSSLKATGDQCFYFKPVCFFTYTYSNVNRKQWNAHGLL